MERDYTLVIPTYNRSVQLKRLLSYLSKEKASFPIWVLDSSFEPDRLENKKNCELSELNIQYLEFDPTIKPFDKFAQGVAKVKTKYCQLCADDDLIMIEGIHHCLDFLRQNEKFVVAHGYYFMFKECTEQGGMDIPYTLYHAPSYEAKNPIHRLQSLFRNYQALTYGIYSTVVLQKIFAKVQGVEKILARELLSSALAVIYGKVARLPIFTHGRNQGASACYQCWHPLEWLMVDPKSLFAEYQHYAEILTQEIAQSQDFGQAITEIRRLVDLIHMFYLMRHAPESAYDFLLDQMIKGNSLYEVWNNKRVLDPLMETKYIAEISEQLNELPESANDCNRASKFIGLVSRILVRLGLKAEKIASGIEKVRTQVRSYRLHEAFVRPEQHLGIAALTEQKIQKLTLALDNY